MSQRAGAAPAEPRGLERAGSSRSPGRAATWRGPCGGLAEGPLRGQAAATSGGLLVGMSVENSDEQRASEKSLAPG
jgi:hypothetical protein